MHPGKRFISWAGKSLRRKLLLTGIPTVLIALIVLGTLSFLLGRAGIRYEVNERNSQLASLVASNIKVAVDNIWGNVRLFSHQLDTAEDNLSLTARALLELRLGAPLTYRSLYLFDAEGNLLIYLNEPLDQLTQIDNVSQIINRPPITPVADISTTYELAQTSSIYISPPQITGVDQVPINYMGIPIINAAGDISQVVVAEIDLRDIWRRIDEIQIQQTGRAFIVSPNNLIIAHPERSYIGQPIPAELEPVSQGFAGQTEYQDPLTGADMLAAYTPISGQANWGVVVEQEISEALAPINNIALVTLITLLGAGALGTLVTILLSRNITEPIRQLAETTEAIARTGDLSHDVVVQGEDEVDQLAETFNKMIASLRNAQTRLLKAEADAQELRIAKEIQATLLKQNYQLNSILDVASQTISAREVGGDFYAIYNLSSPSNPTEDTFGVAVGDVSGKGLPGALYMAVTSSILAAKAKSNPNVSQLYHELNDLLYPRMVRNNMNTALVYVYLNFAVPWTAQVINAGLISPLLRRGNTCDFLEIGGLPLGVVSNPPPYRKIKLPLQEDDWLVLCSDGIIEAMNAGREMYGFDRLQDAVARFRGEAASEMVTWVMEDIRDFLQGEAPQDDMTLVAIHLQAQA